MEQGEHLTLVLRELARELDALSKVVRKLSGIPEPDREYLTSDEVAARLRIHPQSVDRLVRQGLPCYRIGKGPKFLWSEVQTYLKKNYHDGFPGNWTGANAGRRVA